MEKTSPQNIRGYTDTFYSVWWRGVQESVYSHLHDGECDSNHRSRSHPVRVHLSTRPLELARLLRRRSRVSTHLTIDVPPTAAFELRL